MGTRKYCDWCGKKYDGCDEKRPSGEWYCLDCISKIPEYIWKENKSILDFDNFANLMQCIEHSKNDLTSIFKETASYGKLHVDEINKLFYIETGFFDEPVYFELCYICKAEFHYSPQKESGRIFATVKGNVNFNFEMSYPFLKVNCVCIDKNVAVAATTTTDYNYDYVNRTYDKEITYNYSEPIGLDNFREIFYNACISSIEEKR